MTLFKTLTHNSAYQDMKRGTGGQRTEKNNNNKKENCTEVEDNVISIHILLKKPSLFNYCIYSIYFCLLGPK
jgi:hypothetical protein